MIDDDEEAKQAFTGAFGKLRNLPPVDGGGLEERLARESEAAGPRGDGRTLRKTGRTKPLNMKIAPATHERLMRSLDFRQGRRQPCTGPQRA